MSPRWFWLIVLPARALRLWFAFYWTLLTVLCVGLLAYHLAGPGAVVALGLVVATATVVLASRGRTESALWRFLLLEVPARAVDVWFVGYYALIGIMGATAIVGVIVMLALDQFGIRWGW
jgi:hypothetical protein